MGYTIIDDICFIRTDKYVVPVMLGGSNNCTEYVGGREVRERSWMLLPYKLSVGYTHEEFLNFCNEHRGEELCAKYHGNWISDFGGMLVRAYNRAATLEDIISVNKCQALSLMAIGDGSAVLKHDIVRTSSDLDAWIDSLDKVVGLRNTEAYFGGREPLKKVQKVPKIVSGKVVLKRGYTYVQKYEGDETRWRSVTQTRNPEDAQVFSAEEAAAICRVKGMEKWKIVSAEIVEKNWIIVNYVSGSIRFLQKKTKNRYYLVPSPEEVLMRFKTEKEVVSYINKIKGSVRGEIQPFYLKGFSGDPEAL